MIFSEKIENEIKFFKENTSIHTFLENYNDKVFQKNLDYCLNNFDKFYIIFPHEVFGQLEDIDFLNSIIEKNPDKKIYLSCATSTKIKNGFEPIVNILSWRNQKIRKEIGWNSVQEVNLFDEFLFKDIRKNSKGIFSVRKHLKSRDYVFSKINLNKFDGYIRYSRLPDHGTFNRNISKYTNLNNNYPNFYELIDQYKKSYVSFIMETEHVTFLNNLTEKTLISFLTKTIPIIYNGKNYVKELRDMGLYVWNYEFEYSENIDNLETFSKYKLDAFIKSIEIFNKMGMNEIEKLYFDNLEKIENNYKIIYRLLFEK